MRTLSWGRPLAVRPQLVVSALVLFAGACGWLSLPRASKTTWAAPVITPSSAVAGIMHTEPVDCSKVACLALTFDDGPDARFTPPILDILDRYQIKATFFVQGVRVGNNQELLRRTYNAGHEIGNHSWGHPRFTEISLEQVENEVSSTQAAIMEAGVPAPHLFRPPYGDINPAVAAHIPLTVIRWNIDPEDWHPKKRVHLLEHVAAHARPGGVIILHDTEETTVGVLEPLIQQLQASNYHFVTVSELLELPPGQTGVFFNR